MDRQKGQHIHVQRPGDFCLCGGQHGVGPRSRTGNEAADGTHEWADAQIDTSPFGQCVCQIGCHAGNGHDDAHQDEQPGDGCHPLP